MTKTKLTEQQWRDKLTPEQYVICREQGTEPAFSGKYEGCKDEGVYHCVCCDNPLFDADSKFNSGSGWPSYWQPMDDDSLQENFDDSYGMCRVEVTCKACAAHLGHVFEDGPQPTGQRYCINSVALELKKKR